MSKYIVSIEEFLSAKENLKEQIIKSNIKYDCIVANLRGGFFLADILSRELEIPYMVTRISLRDSKMFDDRCLNHELTFDNSKNYLFVDDLVDSGETVKQLERLKMVDVAVIFRNMKVESSKRIYHYKELPENTWIDFFWEVY